jgi:hypothetical protein
MSIVKPSASRAFVRNAKLPALPRTRATRAEPAAPPPDFKDKDAQALVVGSSLVVAADKVPAQVRADLVNCTLFAQLAASGSTSPEDVSAWYTEYFRALTALGWAQHENTFKTYKASGSGLETHKSITKILGLLLGPQVAAVTLITETLDALQSMNENSPWISLFDHQSVTNKSAHFQVATAQYSGTDMLEIALVGFDMKSKQQLTQVLFFKFNSSKITMKYAGGRATIFEAALAESRDDVAARLTEYRKAFVKEVKFPPLAAPAAAPPTRSGPRGPGQRAIPGIMKD